MISVWNGEASIKSTAEAARFPGNMRRVQAMEVEDGRYLPGLFKCPRGIPPCFRAFIFCHDCRESWDGGHLTQGRDRIINRGGSDHWRWPRGTSAPSLPDRRVIKNWARARVIVFHGHRPGPRESNL